MALQLALLWCPTCLALSGAACCPGREGILMEQGKTQQTLWFTCFCSISLLMSMPSYQLSDFLNCLSADDVNSFISHAYIHCLVRKRCQNSLLPHLALAHSGSTATHSGFCTPHVTSLRFCCMSHFLRRCQAPVLFPKIHYLLAPVSLSQPYALFSPLLCEPFQSWVWRTASSLANEASAAGARPVSKSRGW